MSDTMTDLDHSQNGTHQPEPKPTKEDRAAARAAKAAIREAEKALKPATLIALEDATSALDDAEAAQTKAVAAELKAHRAYLDAKATRQKTDTDVTAAETAKATARTAHKDWTLKQATAKDVA
jgi:Tfp pilus assembly protein PilX